MRARWAAALMMASAMIFAGAAGAASATDPVQLGSGYVLDQVGALDSSQTAAVEKRSADLYAAQGVDLYVVLVDEFTNPSSSQQWADDVALANGLGTKQYLLAVATQSRQFYISADTSGPLSDAQLTAIEADIKPLLSKGDYAGAAIAAADGMSAALGGGSGPAAGGSGAGTIVTIVAVIAIIAVIVWLIVRSRRRKGAIGTGTGAGAAPEIDTKELARQASSALIQTDDAIKTSEQELGFARAQFGDAATGEFEQALATAKSNLGTAFTLKQQLDDGVKDTEEETRTWNTQILHLCAEANAGLDEKAAAFDELRKLEQNAPEALARVQAQRDTAAADIETATSRLASLGTRYAPEALATVADNPPQAAQRLAFADEQLTAARTAIGAGKGGEAAVNIRAAEEAVGQTTLLEQAIGKLGQDLDASEKSAAGLVAELESDIATASALPDTDGRVAGVIAATRQQVDSARAALATSPLQPLAILAGLQSANERIDAVVQGVRDAAAQEQRSRQQLGHALAQARAQVSAAEDYITARRGAIGAEARTRLAEAGASLVQAEQLQTTDPGQALQLAQRANQLAGRAIEYAQGDVGAFQGGGMEGLGGMFDGGGSRGASGDGGMLGAILGGIVINSMLGGGGGGSSRSGRSSGGGGVFGGGGSSRSSGRISPGSFGGGGTRGRRGGGRF